ncbi:hypothetical protein EDB83DRAFT_2571343 [Lactarius deliciosus]|nr:hypothetical protein EDB83DRAFT_2571343 [Lactarius deliciosus]
MRASCIAFVVLAAAAAPALSASVVARGPGPKLVGSRRSADELIGRDEQLTGVPPSTSHWDNTQPINTHKRFTDRLIDRDEDESIGATSPTSQHGPPWHGAKRSTDKLIDRDEGEESSVPPSLPQVNGRNEDISVPPSLLNDREEAIPPSPYNPSPQSVRERFTDELIGREGDSGQGWRKTDELIGREGDSGQGWRKTDELIGREGDPAQGWRKTDELIGREGDSAQGWRKTDELIGREGDSAQGWRKTDDLIGREGDSAQGWRKTDKLLVRDKAIAARDD